MLSLSLWTRGCFTVGARGERRYVCVSHFFTANLFKHARVLVSVRKMKYFLPSQSSVSNKVITPDFKWPIKALLLMALEYLRNKVLFMTERFDPNQTAISNNDTNENLSMILFLQFFIGLLSFCCRELLVHIRTFVIRIKIKQLLFFISNIFHYHKYKWQIWKLILHTCRKWSTLITLNFLNYIMLPLHTSFMNQALKAGYVNKSGV